LEEHPIMDTAGGLARRARGDRGATTAEYSLLLALLAILCIGALTMLGLRTAGVFGDADDGFEPPPTCCEIPVSTPVSPGATAPTSTTSPPCPPDEPPAGPGCATTTTAP
jgi:Flp pilus assembly pilin Flp